MPYEAPRERVRISLSTTPAQRLAMLEAIALDAQRWPAVQYAARALRATAKTPRELASLTLAYVQSLPFVNDPPGVEEFQPVALTLWRGGDCDDLAAAFRALTLANGIPSRMLWMDFESQGEPYNHITAQVRLDPDSDQWSWAEPSVIGAAIDEEPLAAAARVGDWRLRGGR